MPPVPPALPPGVVDEPEDPVFVLLPESLFITHMMPKTATIKIKSPPIRNGRYLKMEPFGLANSTSGLGGGGMTGAVLGAPAPAGNVLAETEDSAVMV